MTTNNIMFSKNDINRINEIIGGEHMDSMRRRTPNNHHNLMEEIEFWIESVPFSSFVNSISQEVIGQEGLSILLGNVYNYLYNVANELPTNNNMILAAPSGSGKTETYRVLKKYFKDYIPSLPIYIQDMSRITATGYKGMDPADLLMPFFHMGLYNAIGLVFLDEFDKKLIPSYNGMGQDTNREAQSCLLTLVEGSMIQNKMGEAVDTSNIMFIGLGSFDECRANKNSKPNEMGFESDFNEKVKLYTNISKKDMIEAGGIYELIGRFPIIINYNELDEDGIRKVIHKTVHSIENTFNCSLDISNEMMNYLISESNGHFGCRMIDSILRQNVLIEYTKAMMHPNPKKKLSIIFKNENNVTYKWNALSKKELAEKSLLDAFDNAVNIPNFMYQNK